MERARHRGSRNRIVQNGGALPAELCHKTHVKVSAGRKVPFTYITDVKVSAGRKVPYTKSKNIFSGPSS